MAQEMTPEKLISEALEQMEHRPMKLYPFSALKNAAAPFGLYRRSAESEEDALDGPTGLMSADFEISIVAATYEQLSAYCMAARAALLELRGVERNGLLIESVTVRQASPDLEETEVNLYRRVYILHIDYQYTR